MDGLYLDYLATVGFPEPNGNPSGNLATNPQSTESPDSGTKQPTEAASGAAEQGNRPAPRGRMRTVFSEEQKRRLMQRFHRQRYISPQERAELARALGLNCKQVKTWYQNRRMKLKRSQYSQSPASIWSRPNFNSVSSQSLSLTQTLTPDLMQCHLLSYGQESLLCSGQVLPLGAPNPPLERPVTEVLQPSSIHRDSQNSSALIHFQNSQLANHPDPHFGSLRPRNLMIPQAPSPGFSNQIPRSGMGHSSLGILQTPSVQDELQYFAMPTSYPPTQDDYMLPSEAGVSGSSQDVQIYQNNWCSMQSGSSSEYMMFTPVLDTYNAEPSALAEPFGQGFVG